jgi:putative addiction module component (TIGR02574 family)
VYNAIVLKGLDLRWQHWITTMSIANDPSAVFAAALSLPREKREELAQELIISLDRDVPKHPDYDRLWAEEIQRRWAAYERGEVELVDNEQVMQRIEKAIERARQS